MYSEQTSNMRNKNGSFFVCCLCGSFFFGREMFLVVCDRSFLFVLFGLISIFRVLYRFAHLSFSRRPLEVYGHDGVATNVTMEPGDMVLYESHSVIHGRPFPMQGRFYANVFAHFEPIGPLDPDDPSDGYDPTTDLPPYLIPGSKWEKEWRKSNPDGWKGVRNMSLYQAMIAFLGGIKLFLLSSFQ